MPLSSSVSVIHVKHSPVGVLSLLPALGQGLLLLLPVVGPLGRKFHLSVSSTGGGGGMRGGATVALLWAGPPGGTFHQGGKIHTASCIGSCSWWRVVVVEELNSESPTHS